MKRGSIRFARLTRVQPMLVLTALCRASLQPLQSSRAQHKWARRQPAGPLATEPDPPRTSDPAGLTRSLGT